MASWSEALKQPRVAIPLACVLGLLVLGGLGWLIFREPIEAGLFALVVMALVMIALYWRAKFASEREERLGRGVDDHGDETEEAAAEGAVARVHERVRRARDEIRSSLGPDGAQEVPWLLVIGDVASGKSSLLQHSGLRMPAQFERATDPGPTENCDWWLANEAIAIDTAGRYLRGADEDDADEWRTLLRLIRRQRSPICLDGVVLAVSVESLLTSAHADLEKQARAARRRLNEIEDITGVRPPVYVILTQCDRLEGFVETVHTLATQLPHVAAEAVGWTNDQRNFADAGRLFEDGSASLLERLEGLAPTLVGMAPDLQTRRRLYAFPQELRSAFEALQTFIGAGFERSRFAEVPFLRGVYLTSAKRQGTTTSAQLQNLGAPWAQHDVSGTLPGGGVFTQELFQEIVLGDQGVALPYDRTSPRGRKLVHGAAATLLLLIGGAWIYSFQWNYRQIDALSEKSEVAIRGRSGLAHLDDLRRTIDAADGGRTFMRELGLGGALERELAHAKGQYLQAFGNEFETPTRERLHTSVGGDGESALQALATLAQDVSWMQDLERTDGSASEIADLTPYTEELSDDERALFTGAYEAYGTWLDRPVLEDTAKTGAGLVSEHGLRLLSDESFKPWAASRAGAITYESLELPGATLGGSQVDGGYTRDAFDLVAKIIRTVRDAGEDVDAFETQYAVDYDAQWRAFLRDVPKPEFRQSSVTRSAYVRLVETIDANTQVDLQRGELPRWIALLREVRRAQPGSPEEPAAPWQRYTALLEEIGGATATATNDATQALALAREMKDRKSPFDKALEGVGELVPSGYDPEAEADLTAVLELPILNGASQVLAAALGKLDETWQEGVYIPYSGSRLTQSQRLTLYGGRGPLQDFVDGELDGFWSRTGPVDVIRDRRLPIGCDAEGWLRGADNVRRSIDRSIRFRVEGVPASSSGTAVAKREFVLRCGGTETKHLFYEQRPRPKSFEWSNACTEVEIRVYDKDDNEFEPRYTGDGGSLFALPDLINRAGRRSGTFEWTARYSRPDARVSLPYRIENAEALRRLRHRKPPTTLAACRSGASPE